MAFRRRTCPFAWHIFESVFHQKEYLHTLARTRRYCEKRHAGCIRYDQIPAYRKSIPNHGSFIALAAEHTATLARSLSIACLTPGRSSRIGWCPLLTISTQLVPPNNRLSSWERPTGLIRSKSPATNTAGAVILSYCGSLCSRSTIASQVAA
jgi:phage terminase large subunit GpA-like protein